jgi:hypothetical protein
VDGQIRATALRCREQRVQVHGDLGRGAVETGERFHGEGEGGFEALKAALIEEAARRLASRRLTA